MTLRIGLYPVTPNYERLVTGLSTAVDWVLWIEPKGNFYEHEMAAICQAFEPLRGIVRKKGFDDTEKLKKYPKRPIGKRAFNKGSALGKNIITQITIERKIEIDKPFFFEKTYFDIAWVTPNSYVELVNNFPSSFIPDNNESAWRWANSVYGLLWVGLKHYPQSRTSPPTFDENSVFLNYLKLTLSIGGVVSTSYDEHRHGSEGLVFFGQKETLKTAFTRLEEHTIYPGTDFNHEINQGNINLHIR